MSGQPTRDPYRGTKAGLVISIDLGTTFSGASYTFLIPGEVARVYCVTGYVLLIHGVPRVGELRDFSDSADKKINL